MFFRSLYFSAALKYKIQEETLCLRCIRWIKKWIDCWKGAIMIEHFHVFYHQSQFSWLILWGKHFLQPTCESRSQTATMTSMIVSPFLVCTLAHAGTFAVWCLYVPTHSHRGHLDLLLSSFYPVKQECPHPNSSLCCPWFTEATGRLQVQCGEIIQVIVQDLSRWTGLELQHQGWPHCWTDQPKLQVLYVHRRAKTSNYVKTLLWRK